MMYCVAWLCVRWSVWRFSRVWIGVVLQSKGKERKGKEPLPACLPALPSHAVVERSKDRYTTTYIYIYTPLVIFNTAPTHTSPASFPYPLLSPSPFPPPLPPPPRHVLSWWSVSAQSRQTAGKASSHQNYVPEYYTCQT